MESWATEIKKKTCAQLHSKILSYSTACNNMIPYQCDIGEWFFIPEMFEGGDYVGLEVIPTKAELLLILGHLELGSENKKKKYVKKIWMQSFLGNAYQIRYM